jgi:hypothetical protein
MDNQSKASVALDVDVFFTVIIKNSFENYFEN